MDLDALRAKLAATPALRPTGRVLGVTGLALRMAVPGVRVGDVVTVQRRGGPLACEVVGFGDDEAIAMPLGHLTGVGPDDPVESTGGPLQVRASRALLGRVVDGLGRPLEGPAIAGGVPVPVDRDPPNPLRRRAIDTPLATGVRVLDGLLTLGEGQRIGLFAGSGVGKSTLLGAIARGASADVVVVALVGERGREVGGVPRPVARPRGARAERRGRGDERRPRAREAPRRAGGDRLRGGVPRRGRPRAAPGRLGHALRARAARDRPRGGGAAGAARLSAERLRDAPAPARALGPGRDGVDHRHLHGPRRGGDMDEPIADEVRGILDGHVVLDRAIAARGRYPAVDVTASLSRVMDSVVVARAPRRRAAPARLRRAHEAKRDLVDDGGYAKGSDKELDEALLRIPRIEAFLRQDAGTPVPLAGAIAALVEAVR